MSEPARRASFRPAMVRLAPTTPNDPEDVWLPVETRPRASKSLAALYVQADGARSDALRVAARLLDVIGDPDHVVIHVNPRRRQLRLVPNVQGRGRRVVRPKDGRTQSVVTATGIAEALGIRQAPRMVIVRFDAMATEEYITLTLRGEP